MQASSATRMAGWLVSGAGGSLRGKRLALRNVEAGAEEVTGVEGGFERGEMWFEAKSLVGGGTVLLLHGTPLETPHDAATGRGLPLLAGGWLEQEVDSVCVHGDTPGAVDLVRQIRLALESAGIRVAPFSGDE